jgi:aminopeptidase N
LSETVSDDTKSWNGDKLSIVDFAASWTEQMGYPVIEMKRIDETTIELAQKRFKLDESAKEQERFRNAKYWFVFILTK